MSSCSHGTRPVHGRVPEETARIYPGTPDADRSVPRKAAAYVRAIEGVAAGRGLCALEADRGRGHPAAALKVPS